MLEIFNPFQKKKKKRKKERKKEKKQILIKSKFNYQLIENGQSFFVLFLKDILTWWNKVQME